MELQRAITGVEGSLQAPVVDVMSRDVPRVDADVSVLDAEERMEREGLPALLVVDPDGRPVGLLPRPVIARSRAR
jgi:CBS domain-containing protein